MNTFSDEERVEFVQSLSNHDLELYARIDEILIYFWDPLKVNSFAEKRNEYTAYVPLLLDLLKAGEDSAVSSFLEDLELELTTEKANADKVTSILMVLNRAKDFFNTKYSEASN